MKQKESEKLIRHFDTFFQQTDCTVLHPTIPMDPHIDALLYEPNEKYPFWKLVTMGASDYKMPAPKQALGNRNEYMMFIDSGEPMHDPAVANWYYQQLLEVAFYAIDQKAFVTYGHSMEWGEEAGEEMVGAYLEMPQAIEDVGVLRCDLSIFKTTVCLQVILLNRTEMDKRMELGAEEFGYWLYPEEGKAHFLCERYRSDRF